MSSVHEVIERLKRRRDGDKNWQVTVAGISTLRMPTFHYFEKFGLALTFTNDFNNHPDRINDNLVAYGPKKY